MFTFRKLSMLVFTSMTLYFTSCVPTGTTTGPVPGTNDTAQKWLSWVGVFGKEATPGERAAFLDSLQAQLLAVRSDVTPTPADSVNRPYLYYLHRYLRDSSVNPFQITNVVVNFCNCGDSLLFNIDADLNYGTDPAGPSTPTSPRPPSGTTVSGDLLDAIANNEDMSNPSVNTSFIDPSSPLKIPPGYRLASAVLAIIDTGIDTLLLDEDLRKASIRYDGSRNFVLGEDCNDLRDQHPIRHGTSVASIVLNAFYRESDQSYIPGLMILKAADSTGHGTLFNYTCALDYAIKRRVSLINSSMGYYGPENPVINLYLNLARADSIPLIAAAGNADGSHSDPLCRGDANPGNIIGPSRLFNPASAAHEQERYLVISVTGMSVPGRACYFQNYSEEYVTLGVLNQAVEPGCCSFRLPFISENRDIEGSSFATPVVSGRLGFRTFQNGRRATVFRHLELLRDIQSAPVIDQGRVTRGNNYFPY